MSKGKSSVPVTSHSLNPPDTQLLVSELRRLIEEAWCDDGVGYGDYLEQLTYLLFLKMAHEYAQEPYNCDTHIPAGYDWPHLKTRVGEPLEAQYLATLHRLGGEPGMLGAIFYKAQNKIQDPACGTGGFFLGAQQCWGKT